MKHLLLFCCLLSLLTACVPKQQYAALEAERNYYRKQTVLADSLADQRAIATYDEVEDSGTELRQKIQEIESLKATNIALNQSYQDIRKRYDELLDQSQRMLSENGEQITSSQQYLAERSAALAAQEAALRQRELNLQARESSPPPAGSSEGPTAYGQVAAPGSNNGIPPLSEAQNSALMVNNILNDLSQLLANNVATADFSIAPAGTNRLEFTLAESVLFTDGFTLGRSGQSLLARVAQVMKNYPAADFVVIGHAYGHASPLRAYEDSTDKAINICEYLTGVGIDGRKIIAGGKGEFDPAGEVATAAGQSANSRIDFQIIVP